MTARIPARSRRQAMDWSLVLVSQGIEAFIDHSDDDGWGLIVPEADHGRAIETLRQYRIENSRWPWRHTLSSEILFDWGSLVWVLVIAVFFWLDRKAGLQDVGLMDASAVSRGQWWRLFTAIFLHADSGHLALNASLGWLVLGLSMGRYGTGVALLASYLAGACGNVTTWLVDRDHHSLGASGMVMGCVGLLAAPSFPILRQHPRALKYLLGGVGAGVMLFLLSGSSAESDLLAHLGGFIGGLALGTLLLLVPRLNQRTTANMFAGAVFCALVLLPWWLALRGRG